jgi:hypothetical protein
VHSLGKRRSALELLATGLSLSEVSRRTAVSRSTLREWRGRPGGSPPEPHCHRCGGELPPGAAYAALLGFYLGDGCVSAARSSFTLRVSCDATQPGIIRDVSRQLELVRPGLGVFHVRAPGTVVVHANWKHWPCLFPQHGPGRKHERRILLEGWQQEIVDEHGFDFLRGLFHSDGCRVCNWATRTVAGQRKRYDYGRWMFVNRSGDIIDLCTASLDAAGIRWRRPRVNCIAVSRADDVRRLDDRIGLKG